LCERGSLQTKCCEEECVKGLHDKNG
jgi:hypothetical protein